MVKQLHPNRSREGNHSFMLSLHWQFNQTTIHIRVYFSHQIPMKAGRCDYIFATVQIQHGIIHTNSCIQAMIYASSSINRLIKFKNTTEMRLPIHAIIRNNDVSIRHCCRSHRAQMAWMRNQSASTEVSHNTMGEYNMMLYIALQWQRFDIDQTFNSQNTPHSSPVRVRYGCLL